jgi:hypothetical protein
MISTRPVLSCFAALLAISVAIPASADVTLKFKGSGKGMVGAMSGDMTQYVKGLKLRVDQTAGTGRQTTVIIDAGTKQMTVIDHEKKTAEAIDMTTFGAAMAKMEMAEASVSVTPTGETRQVAGASCTVHDVKVSMPMKMGASAITMVMSGPQCLAKDAPGYADFAAFYKAASDNGFFMDASQAKAQPAAAKAMADMQRKIAQAGMPLFSETNISMETDGPMAEMMKKMGNTIISEVTSISTAPIADALFEVPAGYKLNKR